MTIHGPDPLDEAEKKLEELQGTVAEERHKDHRSALIIVVALILAALVAGGIVAYSAHEAERQQDIAQGARAGEHEAVIKSSKAISTASAANSQANKVADPVLELCKTPSIREELEKSGACKAAAEVKVGPAGPAGAAGEAGENGRGVSGTKMVAGNLYVEYTDGSTQDVGMVRGSPGPSGASGASGQSGQPGTDGTDGKNGRSITGTDLVDGNLVVSYSTGDPGVFGPVVGPKGDVGAAGTNGTNGTNGVDGKNGRGISSASASNGRLIITYSDGTQADAGPLPVGPKGDPGKDGRGIKSTVCGENGRWTVIYTDGVTDDAGVCRTTVTTTVTAPPPSNSTTPTSTTTTAAVTP